MDAHAVDNVEHLEVALARAVRDGAILRFDSLDQLLQHVRVDLRPTVRRAFEAYGPFDQDLPFCLGNLLVDDDRDGRWGVGRCSGHHAGYWLIVSCGQEHYVEAIRQINATFTKHKESISSN